MEQVKTKEAKPSKAPTTKLHVKKLQSSNKSFAAGKGLKCQPLGIK
jgi:hypothetical protein